MCLGVCLGVCIAPAHRACGPRWCRLALEDAHAPACTATAVAVFFEWMTSVVVKCDVPTERRERRRSRRADGGSAAAAQGAGGGDNETRDWLRVELHRVKKRLARVGRAVDAHALEFEDIRVVWERLRRELGDEAFTQAAGSVLRRVAGDLKDGLPSLRPLTGRPTSVDTGLPATRPSLVLSARPVAPPHMAEVISALPPLGDGPGEANSATPQREDVGAGVDRGGVHAHGGSGACSLCTGSDTLGVAQLGEVLEKLQVEHDDTLQRVVQPVMEIGLYTAYG